LNLSINHNLTHLLAEPMNGIPKGPCSFGGVTPHKMGRCREATEGTYLLGQRRRLWWGVGQSPTVTKALRKASLNGTSRTPSPTFSNGRIISAPTSGRRGRRPLQIIIYYSTIIVAVTFLFAAESSASSLRFSTGSPFPSNTTRLIRVCLHGSYSGSLLYVPQPCEAWLSGRAW